MYGLVTARGGIIIVNTMTGSPTQIGSALTFGSITSVMSAATGQISGAHFDPSQPTRASWVKLAIHRTIVLDRSSTDALLQR